MHFCIQFTQFTDLPLHSNPTKKVYSYSVCAHTYGLYMTLHTAYKASNAGRQIFITRWVSTQTFYGLSGWWWSWPCSQNLCFILIHRALNCYVVIGANLSKPPVTSMHMCVVYHCKKNLGLIQPKLFCFNLNCFVWLFQLQFSLIAQPLYDPPPDLRYFKSLRSSNNSSMKCLAFCPQSTNYATADTWIL